MTKRGPNDGKPIGTPMSSVGRKAAGVTKKISDGRERAHLAKLRQRRKRRDELNAIADRPVDLRPRLAKRDKR